MSLDFSRVLTTGAGGMIGTYIDFGLRTDRSILDVLDEEALMRYVAECRPSAIIHLVGATDTQACERDPLYAYELNVRSTYNVARAARAVNAVMVYVSTSRVFRGDKAAPYGEEDVPEPQTHYGRTKYMGEILTATLAPEHIIARTAWVFGGGVSRDRKFYGTVIKKLLAGEEVSALVDVIGSPTYAKDFVGAIKEMLRKEERGTVHITNAGPATRLDIAAALAKRMKPDGEVRAVNRSHFESGALLPANESVSSSRVALRPWQVALDEYLAAEWNDK